VPFTSHTEPALEPPLHVPELVPALHSRTEKQVSPAPVQPPALHVPPGQSLGWLQYRPALVPSWHVLLVHAPLENPQGAEALLAGPQMFMLPERSTTTSTLGWMAPPTAMVS
jgi:hypothetical protein